MKKTTVNGVPYSCPTYLGRCGPGWQVRVPGAQTVLFSDNVYGGVKEAHQAALDYVSMQAGIGGQNYPMANSERDTKKRKTGVPGVFLCEKHPKGKNVAEYQLQIRVPGVPTRTIYIGTTNTWANRYQEKLAEAKQLRQVFVLQRTGKYSD